MADQRLTCCFCVLVFCVLIAESKPCDIRRWSGCKDLGGESKTQIDGSAKSLILREYLRKQIRQIFENKKSPASPDPVVIVNNEIPNRMSASSILSKKLAAMARARATIQKADQR